MDDRLHVGIARPVGRTRITDADIARVRQALWDTHAFSARQLHDLPDVKIIDIILAARGET